MASGTVKLTVFCKIIIQQVRLYKGGEILMVLAKLYIKEVWKG